MTVESVESWSSPLYCRQYLKKRWNYSLSTKRQDDHAKQNYVDPVKQKAKARAALLSIISNTTLVVAKLAIGIGMQSVSVLSEAVHSGIDLVAALVAGYSVRQSGKPADEDHRYGHGKYENVAGTVEAVLIFAAAFFIIWEAVHKLMSGAYQVDDLSQGIAVMGGSALINYLVSRHLFRVAATTDSIALQADALHLRTDVYTSVGVFAGLVAIKLTGIHILDPLIAIGVAIMIIRAAWDLTKTAFFHILDVKLPEEDEIVIHEVMSEYRQQFLDYHKLRTRKSGHTRYIDMHLVVPKHMTVENGHTLSHAISDAIESRLPHSHILVHIEPCKQDCQECKTCNLLTTKEKVMGNF